MNVKLLFDNWRKSHIALRMKSHVLSEDSENVKMESEPAQNSVSAVKSIDSTIFDSFKGLTSAEEVERVKSGLRLIQHLARSQNNDQVT